MEVEKCFIRTEILASLECSSCIFLESFLGIMNCRYQLKYKGNAMPMATLPGGEPDFCKIQKVVVYEYMEG